MNKRICISTKGCGMQYKSCGIGWSICLVHTAPRMYFKKLIKNKRHATNFRFPAHSQ